MDDRDRMRQIVSSLEICKITWLLFNATHRDATAYHTPVESISRVTQTIRPEDLGCSDEMLFTFGDPASLHR